jgi:hypothetical protein
MALALGWQVESAEITHNGYGGISRSNPGGHASEFEQLLIKLAGEIAERIRFKSCNFIHRLGWSDDKEAIAKLFILPPDVRAPLIREYRKQARAILEARWCYVEAIAAALHEHGTLSAETIKLMVADMEPY